MIEFFQAFVELFNLFKKKYIYLDIESSDISEFHPLSYVNPKAVKKTEFLIFTDSTVNGEKV